MLAKCLLRHGSLEAVERYPDRVREEGGDATICAEFIALNEIRRTSNSEDMIRAAYEKAIQAATGALRDADAKTPKTLVADPQSSTNQRGESSTWLIPAVAWLVLAGLCIWLEDKGSSPILLASIIASAAYLLGVRITIRRNKEREQAVDGNPH